MSQSAQMVVTLSPGVVISMVSGGLAILGAYGAILLGWHKLGSRQKQILTNQENMSKDLVVVKGIDGKIDQFEERREGEHEQLRERVDDRLSVCQVHSGYLQQIMQDMKVQQVVDKSMKELILELKEIAKDSAVLIQETKAAIQNNTTAFNGVIDLLREIKKGAV